MPFFQIAETQITTRDILKPIFALLKICACDPKVESHLVGKLISFVFIISTAFWTVNLAIKLAAEKDDLYNRVNTIINLCIVSQNFFKSYHCYFAKDELSALLDVFYDKFWQTSTIESKYNRWYKMIILSIKIYRGFVIGCLVAFFAWPLLSAKPTLPWEPWSMDLYEEIHTKPTYGIIYVVQCLTTFPPVIIHFLSFDSIFLAMVACSFIQFDMIKDGFRKTAEIMEEDEAYQNIIKNIKHQVVMLKFINDLDKYCNMILLKQYLDAITFTGVFVYMAIQDYRHLYLTGNMFQTLFYSFCGQIIQDQSTEVADAAYECGWENFKSKKLQKSIILVLQRSQKKILISAGGFIYLSFASFINLVQAAYSFLTLLLTIK